MTFVEQRVCTARIARKGFILFVNVSKYFNVSKILQKCVVSMHLKSHINHVVGLAQLLLSWEQRLLYIASLSG